MVGPQPMSRHRAFHPVCHIKFHDPIGSQEVRENDCQEKHHHDDQADGSQFFLTKEPGEKGEEGTLSGRKRVKLCCYGSFKKALVESHSKETLEKGSFDLIITHP